MNFVRDEINGKKDTWREGNGRPSAEQTVKEFLYSCPFATKKEIRDRTGLSYPTIRKYYDDIIREMNQRKTIDELSMESMDMNFVEFDDE